MAQLDLANLADAQVYCGTWAKYNAGSLFGKWMKLADYSDYKEFIKACRELHKDEEAPEFDLQDYEYIDEGLAHSLFHSNRYWDLLDAFTYGHKDIDLDALTAYCYIKSIDLSDEDTDIDDVIRDFEDVYRGHFDSPAEFAEYEAGELEIPKHLEWLFAHIDWEGVWYSNTKYDYDEHDGYYFYSR